MRSKPLSIAIGEKSGGTPLRGVLDGDIPPRERGRVGALAQQPWRAVGDGVDADYRGAAPLAGHVSAFHAGSKSG